MRTGRPSITARWDEARRASLARSRSSTPSGDVRGEQALARNVSGIFALPIGRHTGMARRTTFIDNEVAGAFGRHTPQVVILGAGYDGRALRFADGATRWFEVDLPSTQADKRERLDALGIATEHVTYVSVDLMTGDLAAVLDEEGHDANAPSLFVCEGLFSYLTLEASAVLCRTLRARAPYGSVLVSTFPVLPEAVGRRARVLRAVMDQVLRVIGEPERCEFLPQDAEKLMVVTGWLPARSERVPDHWLRQGSHLLALAAEPDPAARP